MDYIIKMIPGMPETRALVSEIDRRGRIRHNNLEFARGKQGYVSVPCTEKEAEIFRLSDAYHILDLQGNLVAEGSSEKARAAFAAVDAETAAQEILSGGKPSDESRKNNVPTDPNAAFVEDFHASYDAKGPEAFATDEYRRVLSLMGVSLESSATLQDMIAAYQGKRGIQPKSWLEEFHARFDRLSESSRKNITKEDYIKALAELGVQADPEANKDTLIKAYLDSRKPVQ